MAIKFEGVKAGDILYDVHRYKVDRANISKLGTWRVEIIEIDSTGATVRWNGNSPQRWARYRIERLRRSPPKKKSP